MKIGVLQADSVMERLRLTHGDYPDMIEGVLSHAASELGENVTFCTYDVVAGHYPDQLDSCNGYVITGSRQSVYDPDEWIKTLRGYVVDLHDLKIPIIGICFGHQLIADELGGTTEAAAGGWGVGSHIYDIVDSHWCIEPEVKQYRVLVSHKDQVMELPDGARLLASSDFCPNAMFSIDDHILALQGHPEFSRGYSEDLMYMRREIVGERVYQQGVESLQHDLQSPEIAKWIVRFLKRKPV